MPPLRFRGIVGTAVALAIVLRLAFALGYWREKPLTHDELEYLQLGRNLAAGQGYQYDPVPPGESPVMQFGRAPLYPAFIAIVSLVGGEAALLVNVRVTQAFLGGLAVLLIALLARRAAGQRAGVFAAWIAACYPPLVWIPAFVLSESLYAAVALGNVLLLARVIDAGTRGTDRARAGWIGGLAGGAAVLIRPAHVFFLAVLGFWLLVRRRWRLLLPLTAGAIVVVLPWTARNYATYGRPVLVASEGGITFWTGNHPYSPGEGDMAANPAIKLDNRRFRSEHPGLSEEALEPLYYLEAFNRIAERPGWWIGLLARKLFYTFVPLGPSYTLHSARHRVATLVAWSVVLPLGVLGYRLLWGNPLWPRTLVLLGTSAVLACVVFLPQERFRIPVLDPVMIVGTAAWLTLRRGDAAPAPR